MVFFVLLQIIPLPLVFSVRNENRTNLLTCAYFSFRLFKTIFFQNFFTIFVVLSNHFKKTLSNLENKEDLSEEEE
jgi:hypothetical protein